MKSKKEKPQKQKKSVQKPHRRSAKKKTSSSKPDFAKYVVGDIVLFKSYNIIGWLIGNAFQCPSPLYWNSGSRPSNHNGIIGIKGGYPYVYESLGDGFVATPLDRYLEESRGLGDCEFRIVRAKGGLTAYQKKRAQVWLDEHIGTRYDFMSYISHIWRIVLRNAPLCAPIQDKTRFYCTEAVQQFAMSVGLNCPSILSEELIAPIHIEKAVAAGELEVVEHIYKQ